MDVKIVKPHLILAALLALTVIAVRLGGQPTASMDSGINTQLPDQIGPWKGLNVLYCNNPECMTIFIQEDICKDSPCPLCNEPLSGRSLAEKRLLPKDTSISRKQYRNPDGEHVTVTIVVTGTQRSSIHRPEWCLISQGHSIRSTSLHKIPLDNRKPLNVRLLELRKKPARGSQDMPDFSSAYAYWFVSRERETCYHLRRLLWMASDNMFRNTTPRWAFISVATSDADRTNPAIDRLENFIKGLYPMLKNTSASTE